jgi:hypothetical protein
MRSALTLSCALVCLLVSGTVASAQVGRPPVPVVPHAPIVPPHVPVTPHPMQTISPHGVAALPTLRTTPTQYNPVPSATLAVRLVGLIGSPMGQGSLLAASTLVPPPVYVSPAVVAGAQAVAPTPVVIEDTVGWMVPLVLGAGLLGCVAVAIGLTARRSVSAGRIRIAGLPPGEAPEQIRQAWIGLELPLVAGQAPGVLPGTVGVLSQQPEGYGAGYVVDGATAVSILATRDSAAAQWWRINAPHVLVGGYQLVFPAEVCQRIA